MDPYQIEPSQSSRLKINDRFTWPTRFRRTPPHKRLNIAGPSMNDAVLELVRWIDVAEIGFAELAIGYGDDPGALLRFVWRGRRLICPADAFRSVTLNVHSLRAPLNVLTTLSADGHVGFLLNVLLDRMSDENVTPLPTVVIEPSDALEAAEYEMMILGDALAESAAQVARGERSGAVQLDWPAVLTKWSIARRIVKLVIETTPSRPQGTMLACTSLEMEPWVNAVEIAHCVDANRWTLIVEKSSLLSHAARKWMASHSTLRERRPELARWLQEGV